jgi:hypothetical protein
MTNGAKIFHRDNERKRNLYSQTFHPVCLCVSTVLLNDSFHGAKKKQIQIARQRLKSNKKLQKR